MANIWRDPIFDRTSHDVAFALQQIAAWKQSHSHVADVNIDTDKLTLNADGKVYVSNESVVLETNAHTHIENNELVFELGTVYDLKGCLNVSDLNRIEDNITYLSQRLTAYRYIMDTNSKEWTEDSIPTAQDMKRIAANIRSVLNGFVTPDGVANVSDLLLSYEDINALEYNLYLLKQLFDVMVLSFIKSGTYTSGSTNRLPIRR